MKFSINNKVFTHIAASSTSFSTNDILFMFNRFDALCMGFIVPRTMGSASIRNKFKRRCRSTFEIISQNTCFPSVGIVVKPKSINLGFREIKNSFNKLEEKILTKYGDTF